MGTIAAIGLGSNVGPRHVHLKRACDALAALNETRLVRVSPILETAPVGGPPQGPFLNAAAVIDTALGARALLGELRRIEADNGRERRERWGPRTLDLDLLLYGEQTIDQPGLQVPHPRMHQRRFVLAPLAEIAPDLRHPVLQQRVTELLEALDRAQSDAS